MMTWAAGAVAGGPHLVATRPAAAGERRLRASPLATAAQPVCSGQ